MATVKKIGGKIRRLSSGKIAGDCDCCDSDPACILSIIVTVDLEWGDNTVDLDLYGAYARPLNVSGTRPGDNYFDAFTATCKYYPNPDFGSHGFTNNVSHWSTIPTDPLAGGGICFPGEGQCTVVGPLVSPGGEVDGGFGGNPANEHFSFQDSIGAGEFRKFWGWFGQVSQVGAGAITPTRANINVLNLIPIPGARCCKLLINGSQEVLPGDSVDFALTHREQNDKRVIQFDYITNALFGWSTILTFENGGL